MITINEEIKVRSYNGNVLAKVLAEQYNKIAILTMKDALCSSLTSPLFGKLVELNKRVELFVIEDLEMTISKLMQFNPEVIAIFIGKNTKDDKVLFLMNEILSKLKAENYEGDFFFHMRIMKATEKLNKLSEFKDFLEERSYTYGFDFEKGFLKVLFIDLEEKKLIPVREVPLMFEHAVLANKVFNESVVQFKKLKE